jgi:hypothetical protein
MITARAALKYRWRECRGLRSKLVYQPQVLMQKKSVATAWLVFLVKHELGRCFVLSLYWRKYVRQG